MARLPKPRSISDDAREPDAPVSPTPATGSPGEPSKESIPRLTIPLTPEGAPLWDRMRAETADKVRSFLRVHGITEGTASDAPPDAFEPMVVHALYNALGGLAVVAAVARGNTRDSAEVMRFTPAEMEQLTPLTQRLLAKYGGSLVKWQDECALAIVLITMTQAKIARLQRAPRPGVVVPLHPEPTQPA